MVSILVGERLNSLGWQLNAHLIGQATLLDGEAGCFLVRGLEEEFQVRGG